MQANDITQLKSKFKCYELLIGGYLTLEIFSIEQSEHRL